MAVSPTWALVPVKRFSRAKTRLKDVLFDDERADLAKAMLADVLRALSNTAQIDGIAIVSGDPEASIIAKAFGANSIFETLENGLNGAVQQGLDALQPINCRVMVVPADVPLARPGEFAALLGFLDQNSIVLAPALLDGGTNALAMKSPNLLVPQFGEESFRAHQRFARERRLACRIFKSFGIGTDIDSFADLLAVRDAAIDTEAGSYLRKKRVFERIPYPSPLTARAS